MGTLAQLLAPASTPTGPQTTTIQGPHQPNTVEGILTACGLNPETTTFLKPPAVTRKIADDGSTVYTTYRYQPVDKPRIRDWKFDAWRAALPKSEVKAQTVTTPATYLILIADPQLGKKDTEQAAANWRTGILEHIARIRDLTALGRAPERIHIAWMGDETEGVCNNYTNQPHTIELNQTEQLELDFDLRVWTLKQVAELGIPVSASSVISNHGEWTRNGSKDPVTTRADNSSTYVARQVKKLFEEAEQFGGPHITWTIGGSEPGITLNLSGIPCYFSHGYIEKGRGGSTELRTKAAIDRQILGRTDTLGDVKLWFMAHYHHFYSNEFEGRTLFGCPALEAEKSSEYMLDQFGVWSPAGMLGLLVGEGFDRGWSGLNVH